jgi:uncharacterized protein YndB with AHSA1/START domain
MSSTTHTIRLHRVLRAPAERVYRAFLDPDAMAKWLPLTISLRKVDCGTELQIVQEGVPAVIPSENCYVGWQESLALLAQLVEAEVPE